MVDYLASRWPELALSFATFVVCWRLRGAVDGFMFRLAETRRILVESGHAKEKDGMLISVYRNQHVDK